MAAPSSYPRSFILIFSKYIGLDNGIDACSNNHLSTPLLVGIIYVSALQSSIESANSMSNSGADLFPSYLVGMGLWQMVSDGVMT